MKERIILLYISGFMFFLSGCESYFDIEPVGKSTEEQFYHNINEFQASLYAVYSVLREQDFQKTLALIGDGLSDDFIYQYKNNGDFGEDGLKLQNFNITADNEWVRKWYEINYKGIYRANQLLKHINDDIYIRFDESEDDDLRRWQHIYGQALFLRSYYYFNLVRIFGGVSLVPEIIDIKNPVTERSSLEDTYKYIEKDLRTACLFLREGNVTSLADQTVIYSGYGEVTQYAGLGLLMKVLITQANSGDGSQNWIEARNIGRVIVSNHGDVGSSLSFNDILKLEDFYPEYTWEEWKIAFKFDKRIDASLKERLSVENGAGNFRTFSDNNSNRHLANWPDIWRLVSQNLDNNGEPVFVVQTLNIIGVDPDEYNFFTYADQLYATKYDDAHTTALIPSVDLMNLMVGSGADGLDPRNYHGIYSHNMQPNGERPAAFDGDEYWGGLGSDNFQMFVKFFLVEATEQQSGITSSPRNLMLLRYSDVLLLYAEALNESGDHTTPIEIINNIRANLKATVDNKSGDFKYTLGYGPYVYVRDRIRIERRKELAGEKERFFDLLRYGTAGDVIPQSLRVEFATSKGNFNFIKGIHELFPIPQIEIELSHGVIKQNSGY